ncbi:MAG: SUMF1/EgtB/PvdO family nonheme iron enzyme [Pyrinomonadaceae bacterium]
MRINGINRALALILAMFIGMVALVWPAASGVNGQTRPGETPAEQSKPKTPRTTPKKPTPKRPTTITRPVTSNTNTTKPSTDPSANERTFWESIRSSTDPEDFRAYLKQYPNGTFAALAANRLRSLEGIRPANNNTGGTTTTPPARPTDPSGHNPNRYGMEFVRVSAGTFQMGSPASEADRDGDEDPSHSVAITRDFYLSKYELTQGQWKSVMGTTPFNQPGNPNLPAENVSWDEAQELCRRLTALNDGYAYRLPTEAEWEYAARAGSSGPFAGDLDEMAWYKNNSNEKTQPVGTRRPNAWGLHDMHGNVYEWVQDWYLDKYYQDSPDADPTGPRTDSGRGRGFRGGSVRTTPHGCRSAYRNANAPNYKSGEIGIRLARTPTGSGGGSSTGGTAPAVGQTYQDGNGIDFVYVPAGNFLMGSTLSDDEKPVHRVMISTSFYMGKYEVTQAQWKAVMNTNPSQFSGDNRPVEKVSWVDVQEFIRRLNAKSAGVKYRLPTEAEWEYACRAGTTGDHAGPIDEMGWYNQNSDNQTHPVGQKRPNAWGLYDMHGNAWEWVQDVYDSSYYPSSPDTDPTGPATGTGRVIRGGVFGRTDNSARSAYRYLNNQATADTGFGFRLVAVPNR